MQLSDTDVKGVSARIREKLRELDYKEFAYVLIANKLPPEYRSSPCLSFMRNIPFVAVFDPFDPDSTKDGLYYVCNETNDAARARIKTLDDFKKSESRGFGNQDETLCLPLRGTTWVLQQESMSEGAWILKAKDCMYRALTACVDSFGSNRLNFVFLCLSEHSIAQMSDIIECCFSILGESASKHVTVICERQKYAEDLIEKTKEVLRPEVRECCIESVPWHLLEQNVKDMIGPSKFDDVCATTELPYYNGQYQPVLNKLLNSWTDLEVYVPKPKFPSAIATEKADEMEKARRCFYQGEQIKQTNLFCRHDIERTVEKQLKQKVEEELQYLAKPLSDLNFNVKVVRVPYEPGSGATTLCRRVLWDMREKYRCAVVKAITKETDFQVEQLHSVRYDDKSIDFALPVLILMDNLLESAMNNFIDKLIKREAKSKCVVLTTIPISAKTAGERGLSIPPLRQLDEVELFRVNEIVINATQNPDKRKGAEEVLERERRFIWLGLELFGRKYVKIEERLRNHVDSILKQRLKADSIKPVREHVLHFCCFLYLYSNSRVILPHAFVSDMLYDLLKDDKDIARTERVHDIFGGLLLYDHNETIGFYGWRPAHPLVAEVVVMSVNIYETAVAVLEGFSQSTAYAKTYLCDDIVHTFLDRYKLGFKENRKDSVGFESTNWEEDVCEFMEIRSNYSKLIMDILKKEGSSSDGDAVERVLGLLITLCEKSLEAYAWQQLARFLGREIGSKDVSCYAGMITKMLQVAQNQGGNIVVTPGNGFNAAHVAIDMAIKHQPHTYNYLIKGFIEGLKLRELREAMKSVKRNETFEIVKRAIETCRQGEKSYGKACEFASEARDSNKYPVIGLIRLCILFLEVAKSLPCFSEGCMFTSYLEGNEMPRGMKGLDHIDHDYIQEFIPKLHQQLNDLFGEMRIWLNLSLDETEKKNLTRAVNMASECRRKFYKVTGLDRKKFPTPSSFEKHQPSHREQLVQDIFFRRNENSYSDWKQLNDQDLEKIYSLLESSCHTGSASSHAMLVCCKASLYLKKKPALEDLKDIIEKWVHKFSNSEWAHLFKYMIHFPTPDGILDTNVYLSKDSVKRCGELAHKKRGGRWSRHSRPEYFLGKEKGLSALIPAQCFPSADGRLENVNTQFWRSESVVDKLQRLQGKKESKGMILYNGIPIRFDNMRYPNESKDDLWFFVGFTIAGPYAFDPVNKYTLKDMEEKCIQVPRSLPSTSEEKKVAEQDNTLPTGLQRNKTRPNTTRKKVQQLNMNHFPGLPARPKMNEQNAQFKKTPVQENEKLSSARSAFKTVNDEETYASTASRAKTAPKSQMQQRRSASSSRKAKTSIVEAVHASENKCKTPGYEFSSTGTAQQVCHETFEFRPDYLKRKNLESNPKTQS